MENIQRITLDILNNRTYEQAYSKQYDKGRILKIKLVEDGAPLDLTNSIITFKAKRPDGTVVYNHCDVDKKNSEITVELTKQLTVLSGKIPFEIEINVKNEKHTNIVINKVSYGTKVSFLNQIQHMIIPTGDVKNPYSFCSEVKITDITGNFSSKPTPPPSIIVKTSSGETNYLLETIPSTVKFKDVLVSCPCYSASDLKIILNYTDANIVKTVTGTLKIEKAVVDGDEIESTSEFSALQVALSNLAVANAEAKVYYKEMQAISGVKSSATEPTDENVSIWVKTSNLTTATINIPEIKDEETNLTDTWSSQKISEMLNSGGSTIDSEELNTALAEILV